MWAKCGHGEASTAHGIVMDISTARSVREKEVFNPHGQGLHLQAKMSAEDLYLPVPKPLALLCVRAYLLRIA